MFVERVWRGSRLQAAVRVGLLPGVVIGLFQYAESGFLSKGLVSGVFFAVFFGGAMALFMWRQWPGAKRLVGSDRSSVVRAVWLGEDIGESRLAPAVVEFSEVMRRSNERELRLRWFCT